MTTRAVEQVDGWDSRSFSGGYRGLHDLSADGFSGIVTAGPTRLCMTKGKVVGILDGDIEDFEDASGPAYRAPSPALPLLAVMQERGDEVRAQYYTEDTPLEEVDRTLADGNFTGYVELSENVLSGDYYQVYHAGQSMSVAFVGTHGELLTDDEAFGEANDEVGIYKVYPVDIDIVEIPEPEEPADETGGAAAATGVAGDSAADADRSPSPDATTDDAAGPASAPSTEAETADVDAGGDATPDRSHPGDTEQSSDRESNAESVSTADDPDSETQQPADSRDTGEQSTATREADTRQGETNRNVDDQRRESPRDADAPRTDTGRERTGDADTSASQRSRTATDAESERRRDQSESGRQSVETPPSGRDERPANGRSGEPQSPSKGGESRRESRGGGPAGGSGVADLETRSIPSLDPDRTSLADDDPPAGIGGVSGETQTDSTPTRQPSTQRNDDARSGHDTGDQAAGRRSRDTQSEQPPAERAGTPQHEATEQPQGGASHESEPPADAEQLEAELDEREAEIDRLESELETVEGERDELRSELATVREERDELEAQVESLERRVDELRTDDGGDSVGNRRQLSPSEAIDETNLFIRYESKGEPTLEAAHDGRAEAGAVNDNLELQYHTQFDADEVVVNGDAFEVFLTDTIQYRFVEWVARTLPYEIRDTGHEGALKDIYDALPRLDRAELNGAVSVQYQEDGETHRSQERFDVVLRDRMGNPLAVANMNESRDPATGDMMESLIAAAQRVGESKGSLAGGLLVTSSFFEPDAMEAASAATGGGLLSRDSRESYVRLSRKDGFHLCLVEARGQKFNLSVPEI